MWTAEAQSVQGLRVEGEPWAECRLLGPACLLLEATCAVWLRQACVQHGSLRALPRHGRMRADASSQMHLFRCQLRVWADAAAEWSMKHCSEALCRT